MTWLLVDDREDQKVFAALDKQFIQYNKVRLEIGDVTSGSIVFERKELNDYIKSFKTGHIQKQLIDMSNNYTNCFLIIIGETYQIFSSPFLNKRWSLEQHLGSLASISARFPKIRVLQVQNNSQYVKLIKKIVSKLCDGKEVGIHDTELIRSKISHSDMRIKLLCCFDRVGVKRAEKLLKKPEVELVVDEFIKTINT